MERVINYFLEKEQDLNKALNIFYPSEQRR